MQLFVDIFVVCPEKYLFYKIYLNLGLIVMKNGKTSAAVLDAKL